MSRRTAERHPRRVEIRFWRRGRDQPHSGFTIDLSRTGMFLGTSLALEPGERLRLEVVDKDNGFMVEGQVARVHRVSLALRHVQQPGVGVRFLGPGDLVTDLINAARPRSGAAPPRPADPPPPPPDPAPPVSPAASPLPSAQQQAADDLFGPDPKAAAPAPGPAAAPSLATAPAPRAVPAAPAAPTAARTVPVEFVDRASFLAVYHRDIAAGGLFVSSETPAALHEVIVVELRVPVPTKEPLQFEARVVHRFDAATTGVKAGLSGMGVQFLDPDRVRAALAPVVDTLRQ